MMETEDFLDKAGEAVVAVWSDGLECRRWGVLRFMRKPLGRAFLGVAGMFFTAADSGRESKQKGP